MAEAIDRNNRIEWVEKFKPTTEAERNLLCCIFKVNRPDLVSLSSERPKNYEPIVTRLREIFADDTATASVRSQLRAEGFIIRQEEEAVYAINFQKHIILNLSEEGFNLERLKWQPLKHSQLAPSGKGQARSKRPHLPKFKDGGGGSQSEKREWEVGQKGNYDAVDDERSLKR